MVCFGNELVVEKKMPRSFGKISRMFEAVCIEALDSGRFICYCLKLMYETSLQLWKIHLIFLSWVNLVWGKVYLFEAIQNPIFWFLFFSFKSECYSRSSSLGMQVSVLQLSHLTVESLAQNFSSHKVQFPSWAIQNSWLLEEIFIYWAGISNLFKIPGAEIRKSLVVVTM